MGKGLLNAGQIVIALCALTGALSVGSVEGQQAVQLAADDVAIFKAVLDHTIRPEVIRMFPRGTASGPVPMIVLNRTVEACRPDRPIVPGLGCMADEYLNQLAATDLRVSQLFKGILTPSVRTELTRSLRARNTNGSSFPAKMIDGVMTIAPESRSESSKLTEGRWIGYASFSQPGYSADGHAVLNARYFCGGLCGTGWMVLLERRGTEWRVVASEVISVS